MVDKVKLLGADHFILALEKCNNSSGTSGTSGNMCRYVLDLHGDFDTAKFKSTLESNELCRWLSKFEYDSKYSHSTKWSVGLEKKIELIPALESDSIPLEIINSKTDLNQGPLFYFHLIKKDKNSSRLIFSWHHLLMDGYGAALFLQNLIKPISVDKTNNHTSPFSLRLIRDMIRARRYISSTSKGDIQFIESSFSKQVSQGIEFIEFNANETQIIEDQARQHKSTLGMSSYFLACSSISVNNYLIRKGIKPKDFWIPVPQDNRKKGSQWPVIGNHLSFLFYRIKRESISDKTQLTGDIQKQMIAQVKNRIPHSYSHLLNYLRHIPTWLYARLIKGPNGKSLSTFLFTVAAEHPKAFKTINNCTITNAISVPPNTYPPGLTFAFNRFEGKIQIAIPFYQHLFSQKEIDLIKDDLYNELLNK